jgi:hypothetical protein
MFLGCFCVCAREEFGNFAPKLGSISCVLKNWIVHIEELFYSEFDRADKGSLALPVMASRA